jgi:hypothetical protein
MENSRVNLRALIRGAVEPFSLSEGQLISYLCQLNNLPPYDIVRHFDESYILFEHAKPSGALSNTEISAIEAFAHQVFSLPPEEDEFWDSQGAANVGWNTIRDSAIGVLAVLDNSDSGDMA